MTLQKPILNRGGRTKRTLGVQAALEWAFRIEKAQLELPAPKDVAEEGFGFGLEYVLLQRAALGCKVDGGQHKMGSYTHPDAEVIAATVRERAGLHDVRIHDLRHTYASNAVSSGMPIQMVGRLLGRKRCAVHTGLT
ncbi:Phage integrase family protein [Roseovarius marisflavi]|uniref:Phage integrase family protein n=1 Tax=Roseovarius marisflavi TaxID=1054996 RepID=A0A1M7DJ66_9RHOB|nr:Phage integrase family protein [Roseovarius marisflavi]